MEDGVHLMVVRKANRGNFVKGSSSSITLQSRRRRSEDHEARRMMEEVLGGPSDYKVISNSLVQVAFHTWIKGFNDLKLCYCVPNVDQLVGSNVAVIETYLGDHVGSLV